MLEWKTRDYLVGENIWKDECDVTLTKTGIKVLAEVTNRHTTSYDKYHRFKLKNFAQGVVFMTTGLAQMHAVLNHPIDSYISYENNNN